MGQSRRASTEISNKPVTLYSALDCDIHTAAMHTSTFNLGRYSRLALLLFMLAAQGFAVAHDIGDGHALQSDPCPSCIIGHGLGAAISAKYDTPPFQAYQAFTPIACSTAIPTSRVNCHLARAPPKSLRNTHNPN